MKRIFSSFKHQNYKLWFMGQLVSLVGTWMQNTAQAYLAFEITKSPAFLGYVAFANGAPTWIFMLYAGTLVDRWSCRTILIYTQIIMMILAFVMAGMTYMKVLEPWHILLMAAFLGTANSFDAPARQAIVSELVERKDMTNAIALSGAMFNLASTVGPAVAGITYALYGPVFCFVVNGLSFIAVLIALLKMNITPTTKAPLHEPFMKQLREGLSYVAGHHVIAGLVFMAAMMSLFGVSVATIFPSWAVHELSGDARVSGYLQAGRGLGAAIGAFGVAYFAAVMVRGRIIAIGSVLLPLALLSFALVKWLPLSLAFVALIGFSHVMIMNVANGLIHSEVENKLRGRVSSIFGLTFFGLLPVGGLIVGLIAEHLSQPVALIFIAVSFSICAAGLFLSQPHLKRIR